MPLARESRAADPLVQARPRRQECRTASPPSSPSRSCAWWSLPRARSAAFGPFTPGAPGIGDPYFPLDGNGGYDVDHYLLELRYNPTTDVLQGVATIEAEATQKLSAFNLDLNGLNVRRITVDETPGDVDARRATS